MRKARSAKKCLIMQDKKRFAAKQVQSVARACDILRAFRGENEILRVRDLVERTGLHKATVSRLVGTLQAAGFLRRGSTGQYSSGVRFIERRRYKLGYASQTENSPFAHEVTSSIRRAAENTGLELISLDNRSNAKTAIANAERLVKEKVDLAIEFQTFDAVAPIVSSILQKARDSRDCGRHSAPWRYLLWRQ